MSLLAQTEDGKLYYKDNGTFKRFKFDDQKSLNWINQIIDIHRPPGFRWDIPDVPSCARKIS